MKRILVSLVLSLVLVLAIGGSALAAPVTVGEAGSFSVFGEYGMTFDAEGALSVGAGYTISDSIAVGILAQLDDVTFIGGYATLSLGSIVVNAEVLTYSPITWGTVRALYIFDLDTFQLGAGAGSFFFFMNTVFNRFQCRFVFWPVVFDNDGFQ